MAEFYETQALMKTNKEAKFGKGVIKRGVTGPDQIEVDIKYCGICHTDVHLANDEVPMIMPAVYPIVPGHEMAGIVTKVICTRNNLKLEAHQNSWFLKGWKKREELQYWRSCGSGLYGGGLLEMFPM